MVQESKYYYLHSIALQQQQQHHKKQPHPAFSSPHTSATKQKKSLQHLDVHHNKILDTMKWLNYLLRFDRSGLWYLFQSYPFDR